MIYHISAAINFRHTHTGDSLPLTTVRVCKNRCCIKFCIIAWKFFFSVTRHFIKPSFQRFKKSREFLSNLKHISNNDLCHCLHNDPKTVMPCAET